MAPLVVPKLIDGGSASVDRGRARALAAGLKRIAEWRSWLNRRS